MAGLLVSVRSSHEARIALSGGASLIDVKEPARGPLGRSDPATWSEVRAVVPDSIPMSVALGELRDAIDDRSPSALDFEGVTYRKVGLAGAPPDWPVAWRRLRQRWGPGTGWVAVLYQDWEAAKAPPPAEVLDVALRDDECRGVLIDTWDKASSRPFDESCSPFVERVRESGRRIVLAGGIGLEEMRRLAHLSPDYFGVRGAACRGGHRLGPIDSDRVRALAREARRGGRTGA